MTKKKLPTVAYFSMEYGLENDIRLYAGGLGILAGDYLKGAKDHSAPVIGIGILWRQGYTRQYIADNGQPFDTYLNYNYDCMEDTGIKVAVSIRQRQVMCKVWKYERTTVPLYLLDTNLDENHGDDRWITGQLYGWFGEERIAQEIVLGVGGINLLRKLGLPVDVYHFNEGHAVFAGLQLMREKMEKGLTFEEAWDATRKEVVFTTHTPIPQGNEEHTFDRLFYMGANMGLSVEQMVTLGNAPFNMTVAALRLSRKANAVSKLHQKTAKAMWSHIQDGSEIIGITNGIHVPTWSSPEVMASYSDGEALWGAHMGCKKSLIAFIEKRNGIKLNEDSLLIGFSRRAATYKRSNFIFSRPEIMDPLLKEGKIQIVFAGKAHPLDDTGKKIIANIFQMASQHPESVVYLENYDMEIGAALTRGADVWLNNPRRPKEASGTSGMKAAINGVLNLSILDGWWPEACRHGINGWQFGDGFESEDENELDQSDLDAFYRVLLQEVLPTYYQDRGKWIEMMQASIRDVLEPFSVQRMLAEYFSNLYEA